MKSTSGIFGLTTFVDNGDADKIAIKNRDVSFMAGVGFPLGGQ
jgi:hypothetical protein